LLISRDHIFFPSFFFETHSPDTATSQKTFPAPMLVVFARWSVTGVILHCFFHPLRKVMDSNTFWDKRATSVVLGLITTSAAIHEIAGSLHSMSGSTPTNPAACLIFLGSIAPFMVGLMVTIFVSTSDRLLNMTWTTINNMFAGLLGGYAMYLFGLSSLFASTFTNAFAGGIIAGIGASLAVASLIKWP
jgi:hypothetical protein